MTDSAAGASEQEFGSWSPLSVTEASRLFRDAPFRWYICGGHALDLAVGRSWRSHDDLDVGVCRRDLGAVHRYLTDWDLYVAADGHLYPWDGEPLAASRHENNVWVRRQPDSPWAFDILVGGGDSQSWWSRRDPKLRVSWQEAVGYVSDTPYLAPHIQLLMKAKHARPKDDADAAVVVPRLTSSQRSWLSAALPSGHRWQQLLRDADLR